MSSSENYPEFAVCSAMPELTEGITNIEIANLYDARLLFDVPTAFVTRMGMPKLRREYSNNPDSLFEKGIGLGLVACRILGTFDDSYTIEIPTITDPAMLEIPFTGIARQRRTRQ